MPDEFELNQADDDQEDVSFSGEGQDDSSSSTPSDSAEPPSADDQHSDGGMDAAEAGVDGGSSGWQEALEQAGFQSFDDVDKAVKALVESNRQRDEQIRQYADQVRFYQEQAKFREQSAPQPSQQAQVADEPRDPIDDLLKDWTDPSWANKYIEVDESGNRFIPDHVDDETRQKIMSVDRKLRQWQEMMSDPRKFAEAVDRRVERMIQDKFEDSYTQKQVQQQESQTVQQFVNSNAHWLYQRDPATGQYLRDPLTGSYVYSDLGAQFDQTMRELEQEGVTSMAKQIEWARRSMAGMIPQGGPVVRDGNHQLTAQEIAQQKRSEMRGVSGRRKGGQRHFNGVTSSEGAGPTGENTLSFGEAAYAAMMQGA